MSRKLALALVLVLGAAAHAAAQPTVFVVRHAERADDGGSLMMASDPDLSESGRARAERLASMLRSAGVTTILATPYKRTQQTAAPLARALGIEVTTLGPSDAAQVPGLVRASKGNVLIVGHSNTVPEILQSLGVTEEVALGDGDYDNLFIVTPGSPPELVRLHFK